MRDTPPPDPFSGDLPDPTDPRSGGSSQFGPAGSADDDVTEPLSPAEREDVLADLEDLEVFRTLLEPRSVRGLVVDCEDCQEPHYFGWDLLHSNLRHLLDLGQMRVHEPAFDPDPAQYVSWDYARGFADGVLDTAENSED